MPPAEAIAGMARCRDCWAALAVVLAGVGSASAAAQTLPSAPDPASPAFGSWAVPLLIVAAVQSVVMIAGAIGWLYVQYRTLRRREQAADDEANEKGLRGDLTHAREEIEELKAEVQKLGQKLEKVESEARRRETDLRSDYEDRLKTKREQIDWLSATNKRHMETIGEFQASLADISHSFSMIADTMVDLGKGQAAVTQVAQAEGKATRKRVARESRRIIQAKSDPEAPASGEEAQP